MIRVKLAIRERPLPSPPSQNYHYAPLPSFYYANAPSPRYPSPYSPPPPLIPPPPAQFRSFPEGYSPYYSGHYYGPHRPPLRPFLERSASYGGPSAPIDYSPYEWPPRIVPKVGSSTGMTAGAVTGAFGGMNLEEGMRYEEEKIED